MEGFSTKRGEKREREEANISFSSTLIGSSCSVLAADAVDSELWFWLSSVTKPTSSPLGTDSSSMASTSD